MLILASTRTCRKGFHGLSMPCVKENLLCLLRPHLSSDAIVLFYWRWQEKIFPAQFLQAILDFIDFCHVLPSRPSLGYLIILHMNGCSYLNSSLSLSLCIFALFRLDRLIEMGLKLRHLNKSSCVNMVTLKWLIFLLFENHVNGWHRLDTTQIFSQSVQNPQRLVEVTG